ncbi:MAG: RAD55 family ATPase, partial [Candidatus Lutacidiplasmatales archaeon]
IPIAPPPESPRTAALTAPTASDPSPGAASPAAGGPVPSGTPRLDDLLGGGFPESAQVLVTGDSYFGQDLLVYAFLGEGLKRGEPVVIVTADRSASEIAEAAQRVIPDLPRQERAGRVLFVEAAPSPGTDPGAAGDSADHARLLRSVVEAVRRAEATSSGRMRVGFFGLSGVFNQRGERSGLLFVQNLLAILKTRRSLGVFAADDGALSEEQVGTLLGRMDGAIEFKQEEERTFVRVRGLKEAETLDWVECRESEGTLLIGSFELAEAH